MATRERLEDPIRLLVCDDYYLIREGLKTVFSREPDIEVVAEAETAEEALQLVDEYLPDVVVMDILLPGMDGIQATRCIKHAHPGVAVIALTRYDDVDHIMQIYCSGASAYIVKSVKSAELVSTVRTVFSGHVVLPSRVAEAVMRSFEKAPSGNLASGDSGLSVRETEVLRLVAQGLSNKEIARELSISVRTAQNHIANIFQKLELSDRVSAAVYAIHQGLAQPEEVGARSDSELHQPSAS